jgi:hypothetical protein
LSNRTSTLASRASRAATYSSLWLLLAWFCKESRMLTSVISCCLVWGVGLTVWNVLVDKRYQQLYNCHTDEICHIGSEPLELDSS